MLKFRDHIGIDIGSRTMKLVQLYPEGNDKYRLAAYGQVDTPRDKSGPELDVAKVEALKRLFSDSRAGVKQAVINLPESQVYTRVIEMPPLPDLEMAQAVKWQAEQYIPARLEDVVLKHQVISSSPGLNSSGNGQVNVLLVAAPNTLIKAYLDMMQRAGLDVIAMETEVLAVSRALVSAEPVSPTTLLLHMGANTTTFTILVKGELTLTQSISTGGEAMTRSISTSLSMDPLQAEEYKHTYGLDASQLDGKVAAAVRPIVEVILTELKKILAFYTTHSNNEPVKRVVLSGGTALIPGLVHYFMQNLDFEVQEGSPFSRIEMNDQQKKALGSQGPLFVTAIGLAEKLT